MNKHKILDEIFFDEPSREPTFIDKIKVISKWWFHKRIRYNVVIILFQALIFLLFFNTIERRFGLYDGFLEAVLFTVVANILFTLGSIVEIISTLFKSDFNDSRESLWLIGLWFSVFITSFLYLSALT